VEVMHLFKRFQEVGVTVVVATHDLHLVREFAQREIVLDHGRVQGGRDENLPSFSATR
jgi:cell division transport system ATP-binding protein